MNRLDYEKRLTELLLQTPQGQKALEDFMNGPSTFVTKDSGERASYTSGMVRDTAAGKLDYCRLLDGPMLERWAGLLARGAEKYPDVSPGVANWTLANGVEEYTRFKQSAFRHFLQWVRGKVDEDHAAAVIFNINAAEYVKPKLTAWEVQVGYVGCNAPVEGRRHTLHGLPTFDLDHGKMNEEPDLIPVDPEAYM